MPRVYVNSRPKNMKPLEERWSCSLWSEQAAKDWEKLLLLRARELEAGKYHLTLTIL